MPLAASSGFACCGATSTRCPSALRAEEHADTSQRVPTLLVGAGRAGVLAAREIVGRGDMHLDVKGFVDDDADKQGAVIQGIRVLGTTEALPRLVKELGISQVVITIAQISRQEILNLIGLCRKINVGVRIIPGLYDVLQGRVHVTRIRNVQIEDLLGREPVYLDEAQLGQFLAGKRVMVTGAGGSIGSELVRQVARFHPSKILLVERAEFALFEVDGELRRTRPEIEVVPLVADICDEGRMRALFATTRAADRLPRRRPQARADDGGESGRGDQEQRPRHAAGRGAGGRVRRRDVRDDLDRQGRAAHVDHGRDQARRGDRRAGPRQAVRHAASSRCASATCSGRPASVVPIFREQIRRGGPVTVTHPEMRRYFMTIPEAAQLVLQAGAIGQGGEIFILDMGEPVRIVDLARDLITLSGLRPDDDMDIVFTGVRPGEKLFEELELSGEQIAKTRHPKIYIGKLNAYPPEEVAGALRFLADLAREGDGTSVRKFLNSLLPEATLGVRRSTRETSSKAAEAPSDPRPTPPYA